MNTKLFKIIFGLGSIIAVIFFIVFFLKAGENEEQDDLFQKVIASDASAFGIIKKDGSAVLQPLDTEMVAFWNQKLHNSTRVNSRCSSLKFYQFYLGCLEITNKYNHQKLYIDIIISHEIKEINVSNLETNILYRIRGKEKSLLLISR